MGEKVRVGVVGVGDFGRNHVRVYGSLEEVELVGVFDSNAERAREVAAAFQTRAFESLDALAEAVEAASVAVPTREHARVGRALLEQGIDVLVEKPIAGSLAEADELVRTAEQNRRILQVGHTERFNPAVRTAAGIVTRPLFFEVHRMGVFSGRSLDVDVVFDLMIHDLDIVLSLVAAPVEQVHAAGIPVLSSKVDIASVRLEFADGCIANLTASRASTEKVRKLRFFQPHEYVSVDYERRDCLVISLDQEAAAAAARGVPPSLPAGLQFRKLEVEQEEPLHAELRAFAQAVRSRQPAPASGTEGRQALALAEQVAAGIAAHGRKVQAALASTRA